MVSSNVQAHTIFLEHLDITISQHSAASPGDEKDDAQRVDGDSEDVKRERGPEGDEGATKEHGSRHDDHGSQSRGPAGPAVPSGQRVLDSGRGWVARLRCSDRAVDETELVRRGLETLQSRAAPKPSCSLACKSRFAGRSSAGGDSRCSKLRGGGAWLRVYRPNQYWERRAEGGAWR